ncbi:MAG: hypothetical protein R6W87_00885 [Halospina sp.]
MLRRDHQLRADLGRIYSFSLGLRMDEEGTYRRPDVMACRIYARQTLEDIARSQDDPFNYRLLDLWLDVFQRPWDQPTNLHQLLEDLACQVGRGDLKVYLEYDPNLDPSRKPTLGAGSSGHKEAEEELPYKPDPKYTEPKVGSRVHRRKHPDGPEQDPYTIQSDGKPLGAEEGAMPTQYDGMEEPPANHDALVQEGWPDLTYKDNTTYDTFTDAEPVVLSPGTKIYRIVDERAGNAGGFWAYELPENKEAWRRDYAVKDKWNDNGYYVEHVVGDEGLKVWEGPAAGQEYQDGRFYLKGGKKQLFITPGETEPGAPKLTNWPEP